MEKRKVTRTVFGVSRIWGASPRPVAHDHHETRIMVRPNQPSNPGNRAEFANFPGSSALTWHLVFDCTPLHAPDNVTDGGSGVYPSNKWESNRNNFVLPALELRSQGGPAGSVALNLSNKVASGPKKATLDK